MNKFIFICETKVHETEWLWVSPNFGYLQEKWCSVIINRYIHNCWYMYIQRIMHEAELGYKNLIYSSAFWPVMRKIFRYLCRDAKTWKFSIRKFLHGNKTEKHFHPIVVFDFRWCNCFWPKSKIFSQLIVKGWRFFFFQTFKIFKKHRTHHYDYLWCPVQH